MLRDTLHALRRARTLTKIAAAARDVRREVDGERRAVARRALSGLLAEARGIPMKVGQLLATGGAEDPFAPLVEGVEPLPVEAIAPALEHALGKPRNAVFSVFEPGARAASLGQVHRARLLDGTEVAVKVQYPGIASAVHAELRLAGLVPGLGPVRRWGFDLDGYRRVLRDNMARELDYRTEAERQVCVGRLVKVDGLVVPRVFADLSSRTVVVQSWEEGVSLDRAREWPATARLHLGRILVETLFKSLFSAGIVHGDPHPGNYLFREGASGRPEVVLLDYGCTVEVAERQRLALLKLILAFREGGGADPLSCWAAAGFDPAKLGAIDGALGEVTRALLEPFLSDRAFDVRDWQLGARIDASLGELKWWFRSAGPAELLLLMRAFQGLVTQLTTLDAKLPWWPLLVRAVGEQGFARARALVVPRLAAPGVPVAATAKLLKIRVERARERRADLSFPARSALALDEIVPSDVTERIRAAGIDVIAIRDRLGREGLSPQVLFARQDGDCHYRVWLE